MKVICKHCINSCKKFGRVDCDKYTSIARAEVLRKEKATCSNPDRIKELDKILNEFDYGIK